MKVQTFTFNGFQENSSIVYTTEKDAVIIDPGCYDQHEQEAFVDFITSHDLTIHAVLNTHCHLDHIFGNAFCVEKFGVDLYAHKEELFTLGMAEKSAQLYGFPGFIPSPTPTVFIEDKQELQFGTLSFQVIFAPGHSVGHVAFYNTTNNMLIGGDILFKGSFGRTDLPGGSMETLKKSIHERMFTLPENTVVYPGHGPTTTIGEEKEHNYIWQF